MGSLCMAETPEPAAKVKPAAPKSPAPKTASPAKAAVTKTMAEAKAANLKAAAPKAKASAQEKVWDFDDPNRKGRFPDVS